MFRLAASALLLTALPLAQAAGPTITGLVTDRTTGKISPGDTVALIRLEGGMQVAAQTKTGPDGRYTLDLPDAGVHLIRVDHQKAAYFQPAPQGAHTVDVDVYDVAPAVDGIVTEADVLGMQSGPGGVLQVSEDFFVRNSSEPARTQLSDHAYQFFLPEGAKVEGTTAMGPGGMPVSSSPVPLPGQGHYAFVFPVRPGETRFQIQYTLPYNGKTIGWTQRESIATENLVVLLPKAMRFAPADTEWQPAPVNPEAQTFVRKTTPPETPVNFTISGEGELPREAQGGDATNGSNTPPGTNAGDARPGGGLGPPEDKPDPLTRYKGWLLGGLGALLLGGAWWLMRAQPPSARNLPGEQPDMPRALRPALEHALLALEREHALGSVAEKEYADTRKALQGALHRALAREAAQIAQASR